jgi:hypothetical protein
MRGSVGLYRLQLVFIRRLRQRPLMTLLPRLRYQGRVKHRPSMCYPASLQDRGAGKDCEFVVAV